MKMMLTLAASVAAVSFAPAASAETVLDTALPELNNGTDMSTTTTANGTVTTVTGSTRRSAPNAANSWLQKNVANASVGITKDYARSGNGSAFFSGSDGVSKADLEYYFAQPVALSSVQSLAYDLYRDSSSTAGGHLVPSLRLAISDSATAPTQFTYLIFEPIYNGVASVAADAWQSYSITGDSIVWSNNSVLTLPDNTAACRDCFASLSDWQAVNPDFFVYGLSTGIGSGWNGSYRGAVDNISYDFGTAGSGSFNFEVAAVPEPATWAMMIGGFGFVGAAMRRRAVKVAFA